MGVVVRLLVAESQPALDQAGVVSVGLRWACAAYRKNRED
jgi:hypothetical protein